MVVKQLGAFLLWHQVRVTSLHLGEAMGWSSARMKVDDELKWWTLTVSPGSWNPLPLCCWRKGDYPEALNQGGVIGQRPHPCGGPPLPNADWTVQKWKVSLTCSDFTILTWKFHSSHWTEMKIQVKKTAFQIQQVHGIVPVQTKLCKCDFE